MFGCALTSAPRTPAYPVPGSVIRVQFREMGELIKQGGRCITRMVEEYRCPQGMLSVMILRIVNQCPMPRAQGTMRSVLNGVAETVRDDSFFRGRNP